MAYLKDISRLVEAQTSILPKGYGTGAIPASGIIAVDAQGFDRVCHVIQLGTMASGGGFDAEITESATAGGTYTLIASSGMTAITAANAKKVILIDVPVNSAKPFQKIRGTATTAGTVSIAVGATALLYRGSGMKPTTAEDVAQSVYVP